MNHFNDHLNYCNNIHDNLFVRNQVQYYKNLCEQLQEKINMLEANIRSASEIEQIGKEEYEKALEKKRRAKRELSMQDIEAAASETIAPYTQRALKRQRLITTATEQLPDVAQSGDVESAQQYADVMGDVSKRNISGKFAGYGNFSPEDAERIKSGEEKLSNTTKKIRGLGLKPLVPADIAAMRKFIAMGRGQYKAPFPQPGPETTGMAPHSSNATY
jgi:septum formation inhibitor MinC